MDQNSLKCSIWKLFFKNSLEKIVRNVKKKKKAIKKKNYLNVVMLATIMFFISIWAKCLNSTIKIYIIFNFYKYSGPSVHEHNGWRPNWRTN